MGEHEPLEPVHSVVEAELGMKVALRLRVIPQGSEPPRHRLVGSDNQSRLAGGSQIFGRIKTEASAQADRTEATPIETCSDRLRRVLNHRQAVARGERL